MAPDHECDKIEMYRVIPAHRVRWRLVQEDQFRWCPIGAFRYATFNRGAVFGITYGSGDFDHDVA
jgi:hypothetical protein